jgi:hypothetical protein
VADHDRGVQIEDQVRDRLSRRHRARQAGAGLGRLRPGQFPSLGPGGTQPGQSGTIEIGQQPPRGRVGGYRAEQVRLIAQHREVSDRLTTVGEHDRQVHRDPARIMTRLPDPQRAERVAQRARQPRSVGEVSQQPGAGMPDDTPTIGSGNDLRTRPGNLHLESALRGGMDMTLDKSYLPRSEGTFTFPTRRPQPPLTKARG